MRYVVAKVNQCTEELSYKVYMTDCMAMIAHAEKRWYDLLHPVDNENEYQTAIDNFYSDFRKEGGKISGCF